MKKAILIVALVVSSAIMFGFGYITGNWLGYDEGKKDTLLEVYKLYNVKKLPMNESLAIAGIGDEGLRMVWEGGESSDVNKK